MKTDNQNKIGSARCPLRTLRGFTIVEMTVSLGVFTIVLFMSSSAFLSIVSADRKSRVTRIAMDNLNLALEDMSRKIKTGTSYRCGGGVGTGDCVPLSNNTLSFFTQDGQRTTYKRTQGPWPIPVGCGDSVFAGTRGCILRAGADGLFALATSPEIDIKDLKFLVSGSTPYSFGGNIRQPTVVISILGYVGPAVAGPSGQAEKSTFRIQTAVTQSIYDNY